MALTQTLKNKTGVNPTCITPSVSGEATYYFHEWGGKRFYFGIGNPQGSLSAPVGSICHTDEGFFFCNGNGSGAAGTVWFAMTSKPQSAAVTANVEKTVSHPLGHVAQVWAVNASNEMIDVEVTAISTSGFKVTSTVDCTVYYR